MRLLVVLIVSAFLLGGCGGGTDTVVPPVIPPPADSWFVGNAGGILQVSYGQPGNRAQYAALHTHSSYFRMVNTQTTGWGTSVILMPSFWEGGRYHQGARITTTHEVMPDGRLKIVFSGISSGLTTHVEVILTPPDGKTLRAEVSASTTGSVKLDSRAGEAFKPVMLSSMHESDDMWDCVSAFVGDQALPIPTRDWIVHPAMTGRVFGLAGGTSSWNSNAPTITITLPEDRLITGWVTPLTDPNADNVGFWAASDTVLPSWEYTITAKSAS